jgi:hypothetical protein
MIFRRCTGLDVVRGERICVRANLLTVLFRRIALQAAPDARKPTLPSLTGSSPLANCIIRDGSSYREIGQDYFDRINPARTLKNSFSVSIASATPPPLDLKSLPKPAKVIATGYRFTDAP